MSKTYKRGRYLFNAILIMIGMIYGSIFPLFHFVTEHKVPVAPVVQEVVEETYKTPETLNVRFKKGETIKTFCIEGQLFVMSVHGNIEQVWSKPDGRYISSYPVSCDE